MAVKVTTNDGEYTVLIPEKPGEALRALRYGKPWRDCCGDNLILSLASELDDMREEIARLTREKDELLYVCNDALSIYDWALQVAPHLEKGDFPTELAALRETLARMQAKAPKPMDQDNGRHG